MAFVIGNHQGHIHACMIPPARKLLLLAEGPDCLSGGHTGKHACPKQTMEQLTSAQPLFADSLDVGPPSPLLCVSRHGNLD